MKRYPVLLALLLAACTIARPPSPTLTVSPVTGATQTQPPEPTQMATATQTLELHATSTLTTAEPPAAAEDEIVSFALDYILNAEIRDMADFINSTKNSGESWVPGPPKASIIIYGPVVHDPAHPEWGPNVDEQRAIQVWWYEDDKLSEMDQKAEAISRYHEEYMKKPATGIFDWGYYVFAIDSIAEDGSQAKLYVGASCGPVCGHGVLYSIRRQGSGEWQVFDQQFLWQS